MVSLPFEDGEFDTVILDDVLGDAKDPATALLEATRLVKAGGRVLLLAAVRNADISELRVLFAELAASANLRLASPKPVPANNPAWLLAVATSTDRASAAA